MVVRNVLIFVFYLDIKNEKDHAYECSVNVMLSEQLAYVSNINLPQFLISQPISTIVSSSCSSHSWPKPDYQDVNNG